MNSEQLKEAKRNHNFVQLRQERMLDMADLVKVNPIGAQILFWLFSKMDRLQNAAICSYTVLHEQLGYSRQSIAKAVKELEAAQWIAIERSGNMSIYCVNERVAWQAANNQRHYARFSATVLLSSTEQKSDVTMPKGKLKRVPAYFQDLPRDPNMDVPEDVAEKSA